MREIGRPRPLAPFVPNGGGEEGGGTRGRLPSRAIVNNKFALRRRSSGARSRQVLCSSASSGGSNTFPTVTNVIGSSALATVARISPAEFAADDDKFRFGGRDGKIVRTSSVPCRFFGSVRTSRGK
jgi:hypothetical protein